MNNGVENNQTVEPVLTGVTDTNVVNSVTPMPVAETPVINNGVVDNTPAPINSVAVEQVQAPQEAAPVMTTTDAQPVLTAIPAETEQPVLTPTPVVEGEPILAEDNQKKKKGKGLGKFLILLIIVAAIGYGYYSKTSADKMVDELNYKCTPVNETKEEIELDINSTLVQSLYSKVSTTSNEDYAQPEWNDTMKIYLAYRQLTSNQMYDSNCNLFRPGKMEPYTCEVSSTFVPKAFTAEALRLEWKKLFGETTPMPLINIKLENDCVGGFEYIEERDEYVQGWCKQNIAHSFKVKKQIKKAVSDGNTIILTEEVDYSATEKMTVPKYLKSGTYFYTFRLDMNYNYILVSKEYDQKY